MDVGSIFPWKLITKGIQKKKNTYAQVLPYIADTMAGITAAIQQFLFVQLNYSRMKGPREPECSAVSTAMSFLAETLSPLHYFTTEAAQKSLHSSA